MQKALHASSYGANVAIRGKTRYNVGGTTAFMVFKDEWQMSTGRQIRLTSLASCAG